MQPQLLLPASSHSSRWKLLSWNYSSQRLAISLESPQPFTSCPAFQGSTLKVESVREHFSASATAAVIQTNKSHLDYCDCLLTCQPAFPSQQWIFPQPQKWTLKYEFNHVILFSEITNDFQSLGPNHMCRAVSDLAVWYFSNFTPFCCFLSSFPQLIRLCIQWSLHYSSHIPGMAPPKCFWNCSSLRLECCSPGYLHGLYHHFL